MAFSITRRPCAAGCHSLEFVQEIEASPEAELRRQTSREGYASCVNLVYRHFLGRDADPDGLRHYTAAMRDGMPFFRFAQEIEASPEAGYAEQTSRKGTLPASIWSTGIFWDAMPTPMAFGIIRLPCEPGMSFFRVRAGDRGAPEAEQRRLGAGDWTIFRMANLFWRLPNCCLRGVEQLLAEIEYWRKFLREDRTKRSELISNLINDRVAKQRLDVEPPLESSSVLDHGDRSLPDVADWQERAKELNLAKPEPQLAKPVKT